MVFAVTTTKNGITATIFITRSQNIILNSLTNPITQQAKTNPIAMLPASKQPNINILAPIVGFL
jgi:hypothetical protein